MVGDKLARNVGVRYGAPCESYRHFLHCPSMGMNHDQFLVHMKVESRLVAAEKLDNYDFRVIGNVDVEKEALNLGELKWEIEVLEFDLRLCLQLQKLQRL